MSFTPVTLLVGIVLILGALGLFFLDKIRPGYSRDSDKIYAVLLLISGFLSLGHLTAGVTESFQLMLMAGMLFTLVMESIRNREAITEPPVGRMDNRPPRPRYDERPPSRRVYRAELDERNDPRDMGRRPGGTFPGENRGYPPRMAPSQDPRMAPVREDYRRNEYGTPPRSRQPYEEYRGPAGRLQPSREESNRYADGGGNGRYGQRPPAPPSSPNTAPPNAMNGERFPGNPENPQRPSAGRPEPDWNPGKRPERFPEGPPQQQRPPLEDDSTNRGERPRPANGERALNVRPYSEAPKIDLPREGSPKENG